MSAEDGATANYILGHDERELARLEEQAAVWEPATRRALAAVGVEAGSRCLDVGCGPGSVMRILGELVGPAGRVVGADAHAELGRAAVARLNAAGPAIFEFRPIDATVAESAAGGQYDLVFSRLLLCHMTDPVGVLRRMWSWVAPGGVLLVQDYDQSVACAVPEREAVRDGIGIVSATFAATGKRPRVGTEMAGHFFAAGIGTPDGVDVYGHVVAGGVGCAMLAGVMRSLARQAVEHGVAPREGFDATLAAVETLAGEPGLMVRIPDMVATWKRKRT